MIPSKFASTTSHSASPGSADAAGAAAPLLLHVYRFRLRTEGPVEFPTFPGPALRGALGDDRAAYAAFFSPPPVLPQARFADPPRPIVLRPRFAAGAYGEGSVLELDVTLAGRAARHLPALIRALATLGARGVGAGRGRFRLERADALGPGGARDEVVTPGGLVRPSALPWRFPYDFAATDGAAAAGNGSFTVELRSPTLVRRGPDPRGTLELRDLVADLLRRASLLGQAYGDGPVLAREEEEELVREAGTVAIADAAVRWQEVPRYSRSQRAPMTFGGWMGEVRYAADPAPWIGLLRAAAFLHIGKHTAFGFGEVRLGGAS